MGAGGFLGSPEQSSERVSRVVGPTTQQSPISRRTRFGRGARILEFGDHPSDSSDSSEEGQELFETPASPLLSPGGFMGGFTSIFGLGGSEEGSMSEAEEGQNVEGLRLLSKGFDTEALANLRRGTRDILGVFTTGGDNIVFQPDVAADSVTLPLGENILNTPQKRKDNENQVQALTNSLRLLETNQRSLKAAFLKAGRDGDVSKAQELSQRGLDNKTRIQEVQIALSTLDSQRILSMTLKKEAIRMDAKRKNLSRRNAQKGAINIF